MCINLNYHRHGKNGTDHTVQTEHRIKIMAGNYAVRKLCRADLVGGGWILGVTFFS